MRGSSIAGIALVGLVGCGGSMSAPQLAPALPAAAGFKAQYGASAARFVYQFRGGFQGQAPSAPILVNGALYGVAGGGVAPPACGGSGIRCGVAYKISSSGTSYQVLYKFKGGTDGQNPGSLVYLGGNFYGATSSGGRNCEPRLFRTGCGTLFELTASGTERVLYRFSGSDGVGPVNVTAVNGVLYGLTGSGGLQCGGVKTGCGTIFRFSPQTNQLDVVYRFRQNFVQAGLAYRNGWLYGVDAGGGTRHGLIYAVDVATGKMRVVYAFQGGADGNYPLGLAAIGNTLYGVTEVGGTGPCSLYKEPDVGCGTAYAIDPATGKHTVLYSFNGGVDGALPTGIIASNGTLFGTTYIGGGNSICGWGVTYDGCGTVFQVTPQGHESILYSFQGADGAAPNGLTASGGVLYVATGDGGLHSPATTFGAGTLVAVTP